MVHILGLLVKMPTDIRNSLRAPSRTIQPCCTAMQRDTLPVSPRGFWKTQICYNIALKILYLLWSALDRHLTLTIIRSMEQESCC